MPRIAVTVRQGTAEDLPFIDALQSKLVRQCLHLRSCHWRLVRQCLHLRASGTAGELDVDKQWRTPAGHIRDILKAVDALSPRSRGAWDRCRTREANIGYESGLRPRRGQFNQLIPHQLLARMVEVGLSIRVTIYPPDIDG